MKIFVQGRKDGYNVLYPKPTPTEFFQFGCDIQRIDAQNDARYYGKSLYSIAFVGGGCIFTKYVIGYDGQRSNLGYIGISVYIPNNQKMAGLDVKNLLSKLVETYCINYCPDYYINNSKQEDWQLFVLRANGYDARIRSVPTDDVETFQQGTKEASFVLYTSETELQRYFDVPYQEEYSDFKHVFFLERNAQELLKLIKHDTNANLTGKIDLDNPKYKLLFHAEEKGGLQIEVKANGKRQSNKNKVRRKDTLEITYSQKYRLSKTITESWNDIKDRQQDSISVNEANGTITINRIELQEQKLKVVINTLDETTNSPVKANIICRSLRNNDNFYSIVNNQVTFIGNEIGEQWKIEVELSGYKRKEQNFVPESEKSIILKLEKQKIIDNAEHKNIYHNNESKIEKISTDRVNNRGCQDYNRKKYVIWFIGLATILCCIIFGVLFLSFNKENKDAFPINECQIKMYVEGDSLLLCRLTDLKTNLEKQNPEIKKEGGSWYSVIIAIFSKEEKLDSVEFKQWNETAQSIEQAIEKRESINKKEFQKLRMLSFSVAQKYFKDAIVKIDSLKYEEVRQKLGDVEKLTLKQIADSIIVILKSKQLDEEQPVKEKEAEQSTEDQAVGQKPSPKDEHVATSDKTSEIIKYLNSDDLSENQLRKYEKQPIDNLKKSIELCLKLWSLNGKKNNSYDWMLKQIANNPTQYSALTNSALKRFLDKMCNKEQTPNPKYWNQITGNKKKDKTLKNIESQR